VLGLKRNLISLGTFDVGDYGNLSQGGAFKVSKGVMVVQKREIYGGL